MAFKRIVLNKKFPRWNCGHFEDSIVCSFDFHDEYERSNVGVKPTYNPLAKAHFDAKQGPFDAYNIDHVLSINKGFLARTNLIKIFLEYQISNHIVYDGIKYSIKGDVKQDLNFFYVYENMTNFIDYSTCLFHIIDSNKQGSVGTLPYQKRKHLILEDDISFASKEDYLSSRESLKNEGLTLRWHYVSCPPIANLDVFCFHRTDIGANGIFFSERLQERLREEKITGIEYSKNIYFDIGG